MGDGDGHLGIEFRYYIALDPERLFGLNIFDATTCRLGTTAWMQFPRAQHVGWVERSETQQMYQAARPLLSCKVLGFATLYPTYGVFQTILNCYVLRT